MQARKFGSGMAPRLRLVGRVCSIVGHVQPLYAFVRFFDLENSWNSELALVL